MKKTIIALVAAISIIGFFIYEFIFQKKDNDVVTGNISTSSTNISTNTAVLKRLEDLEKRVLGIEECFTN